MAISNTKLLQTNKPLSLPLLAFITMIFLMLLNRVNSADSLSFTFDKFDPDQEDLLLQNATTTEVLQLFNRSSALYFAPVQLWGRSAVVASFDTTFTFVISSPAPYNTPDDVLTFFIASNATYPNVDNFIAVTFDTYSSVDNGDRRHYPHIGIHVNTHRHYCRWVWQNGVTATAHISYNSASRRLSVVSTYPNGEPVICTYDFDWNTEWNRVGFYASTNQIINILYWSFRSSVKSNKVQEDICNASEVKAAT